MKIFKIQSIALAALAIAATACHDDNNSFMVADKLYLHNSGTVETTVFTGVESPTHVVMIKSGKGFTAASVSLEVSQNVLDKTNEASGTSYSMMPANCYTIKNTTIEFAKDDYQKSFEIEWNTANLKAALEQNEDYVLPLLVVNNTKDAIELASDRKSQVIIPKLDTPKVYMGYELNSNGVYVGIMPTVNSLEDYVVYFPVETNFIPQTGLDYTIAVDNDFVAKFNAENGTEYKVLPENVYSFEKLTWNITPKQKIGYFKATIHEANLRPAETNVLYGDYLLPVKLVSTTEGDIDENAQIVPYLIQFNPSEVARSNWKVIAWNSSIRDDSNPGYRSRAHYPYSVLDGNISTMWSSLWTESLLNPPYYLTIDMGAENTICRLGFCNPEGSDAPRGTTKTGYFEISLDGENWQNVGNFELDAPEKPLVYIDCASFVKARYIRFNITSTFPFNGVEGRVSVAEVKAWTF